MWLMAFLPAWKKKNNMTLLLFFEVKAVIEEHYERRIEFYRYVNPPLSREAERELGEWKGKVRLRRKGSCATKSNFRLTMNILHTFINLSVLPNINHECFYPSWEVTLYDLHI